MQAQPGETRAVFLRAETKAFRNRNVSGLDPNDRTLVIRVKVLTCRFLLLFARFGEPTEVFHSGHCLASRAFTRQFLRLFARLKEPRIFYLQIPYTKIPVIITTTF